MPAAPNNVEVKPDKPLYITDANRLFSKVMLYPGGQIFIQTTANISIEVLEKVA
jgi:hypothetical protein